MGSKNRLLPWLHQVLEPLDFESALDPFSGSGCVSYLLKAMGRRVVAADFLNFEPITFAQRRRNTGFDLRREAEENSDAGGDKRAHGDG